MPETQSRLIESRLDPPQALAAHSEEQQVLQHALADASDVVVGGATSVAAAVAELPETETRMYVTDEVGLSTESAAVAMVGQTAVAGRGNGRAGAEPAPDLRPRRGYDKAAHYKLKCPECGGALTTQEGCRKCHGCGWAAC